jgi:hypothetical protein
MHLCWNDVMSWCIDGWNGDVGRGTDADVKTNDFLYFFSLTHQKEGCGNYVPGNISRIECLKNEKS